MTKGGKGSGFSGGGNNTSTNEVSKSYTPVLKGDIYGGSKLYMDTTIYEGSDGKAYAEIKGEMKRVQRNLRGNFNFVK